MAIRDNDLAAEVMGVNLFRYKLLAFFIGCFFAGIAGSLFAHWAGFISPESFPFTNSVLYVGMIIIGGLGTTVGPIFGTLLSSYWVSLLAQLSALYMTSFPAFPAGLNVGISADGFRPGYHIVPDSGAAGAGAPLEPI